MPNYGFASPYLTPPKPATAGNNPNQLDPNTDYYNSDFVKSYLDPLVPKGLFQRWLNTNGYGGPTRRDQFMQAQYPKAQQMYEAAVLSQPDLAFRDFLSGWGGPANDWLAMSANQRGTALPTRTQVVRWG